MERDQFQKIIHEIKAKTDIVAVIGKRLTLDQNNKALCPFHKEDTPSFSVTDQYFHCFGCGVGGDVIEFLRQYENKSFMDVLIELAEQAGVTLPNITPEMKAKMKEQAGIEEILSESANYYHKKLTPETIEYLMKQRGLTKESIDRFKIGWADGKLTDHLNSMGKYSLNLCVQAGVIKEKSDGGGKSDFFYERITIPHIVKGRVVQITGRILTKDVEPKYKHLPLSLPSFYNEDAINAKSLIVVEGFFDCIMSEQAGFKAVALLGNSLTQDKAKKLSVCEKVFVWMDGDAPGQNAIPKVGSAIGVKSRIVMMPDSGDPDDFIRAHTKDQIEELLSSSPDLIDYHLNQIPEGITKIELLDKLKPVIGLLGGLDKAKGEFYLTQKVKPRFRLTNADLNAFKLELKNNATEIKKGWVAKDQQEMQYRKNANFDQLVDVVEKDSKAVYLIRDKNGYYVSNSFAVNETHINKTPEIKHFPWLLPSGDNVLKHIGTYSKNTCKDLDRDLFDDLIKYFKTVSELPGEKYYAFLSAWVMHTYLLEKFQYSPMLCLFAVPERGKSRTGKGITYVAYRGIHVESLRESNILRQSEHLKATLFFDVIDLWDKAEKQQSEDIILSRFEKGIKVARVLHPELGPFEDTDYFSVYGATVIGTNEPVDDILGTRAITINMPESETMFENEVKPGISLPLKERLIAFRAWHMEETIPDIAKPAASRLGDIMKCIFQIINLVKPEELLGMIELINELQESRMLQKTESFEGRLLKAILELLAIIPNNSLGVKHITDQLNIGTPDRFKFSPQRIGRALDSLGFKKVRTNEGGAAILVDLELIKQLCAKYGVVIANPNQLGKPLIHTTPVFYKCYLCI